MTAVENLFVPYELALELKELGFNEPCIMQWTYAPEIIFCTSAWGRPKFKTNEESYSDSGGDCISAPTFSQAFRWFREKYNMIGLVGYCEDNSGKFMAVIDKVNEPIDYDMNPKDTYEAAELACMERLIEIVKTK